jgi:hypothetical protein
MLEFLLMNGRSAALGNVSGFALFGGGYSNAATAVTDRYTYASNAVAAGTALGTARRHLAATSSSPGGF